MIRIKRAYEAAEPSDGRRLLIDQLWPRGLKKEKLAVESWEKQVAPSTALRKWFGHDPGKWAEFRRRYWAELDGKPGVWERLLAAACEADITLVYGARDLEHNNAIVLKEYLDSQMKKAGRKGQEARCRAH